MKFKIVHDTKGRMRVRLNRYSFDRNTGYGIEAILKSNSFIQEADTSSVNCSILISYKYGYREQVLDQLKSINIKNVTPQESSEKHINKETAETFQKTLVNMFAKRCIMKCLMPAPLRTAFTLYSAVSYLKAGISNLLRFNINVEVLDAASVGAALVQRDFATANSIMFLLSLSEVIEKFTKDKARNTLAQNLSLNVQKVWIVKDGKESQIPISALNVGDNVKVRAGSVIPIDGTVKCGEAFVNESSMTGESTLVMKNEGKTVYAGTIVEEGNIVINVTALENDTRLSKIINLIDESENYKAQVQSKAMRLADKIVPFSFMATIGTYLVTRNITKALSVLMVDYSCALKLSTPICVASAMSEAAKYGIVVKGGKFLESFANADAIVFDKTGTLTLAEPAVKHVFAMNDFSEEYVLRTAACLEEHFPHSVAKAIVRKAEEDNLVHAEEHAEVEYIVAHGIASHIDDEKVIIGSAHFVFDDEGIKISEEEKKFIDDKSNGYSSIFLAVGDKIAGFICIDDPLRPEARDVIEKLKAENFEVHMLTGDGEYAAKKISKELGIKNFRYGILPEDKSETVNALKAKGKTVVMVGDGINDTPALAAANVSVSLKESSDIAREVSDIVIMSENLDGIILARKISKNMLSKINSNFRFIVGFNTLLLALGIGGIISPATSALLHNTSTMLISSLSMRNCIK